MSKKLAPPVPDERVTQSGLLRRLVILKRSCGCGDWVPVYGATEVELVVKADLRRALETSPCDVCRVRH